MSILLFLKNQWQKLKQSSKIYLLLPAIIFCYSIYLIINIEPIGLAIFIPVILFFIFFVWIFYKKTIFVKFYTYLLNPILDLFILYIILRINPLTSFTLVLGFVWVSSLSLFASFVSYAWFNYLKKAKHPFQTVQIYLRRPIFIKRQPFLILVGIITFPILSFVKPVLTVTDHLFWFYYLTLFFGYILFLLIGTIGLRFLTNINRLRYCKMALTEIKKGLKLYGKNKYKEESNFIKNYLPIISVVVNEFNDIFKSKYPSLLPYISDSDLYTKALFVSVVKERPRTKGTLKGIEKMYKAIKLKQRKLNCIGFIKGLNNLAGKKAGIHDIAKDIEFEPSVGESVSKNKGLIFGLGITIFLGGFAIYTTALFAFVEAAHEWVKNNWGEVYAKWLFPIGEAQIEIEKYYAELSLASYGGEGPLEGWGYCKYSFTIKNEHFRNIEIESVVFKGPESITRVERIPENMIGFLNFEIRSSEIESPEDLIVQKETRGQVTIHVGVKHDLLALSDYIKENPVESDLLFYGNGMEISVSYKILGTNLRENISKSLDEFNFFFRPEFFVLPKQQ